MKKISSSFFSAEKISDSLCFQVFPRIEFLWISCHKKPDYSDRNPHRGVNNASCELANAYIAHKDGASNQDRLLHRCDLLRISLPQIDQLNLAFDHHKIINVALERLRQKTLYSMVPVFCLPTLFTISDLKQVIETIIEKPIQRKSLMRRVEASGMFEEVDEKAATGKRMAQLYKLKDNFNIVNFERNLSF